LTSAARSYGLRRRGSSCDGRRVTPRSPRRSTLRSVVSLGSIAIKPRLDRLPQRLCGLDVDFASRSRACRSEDGGEPELRAFLETTLSLRRCAEAPGEPDLAESSDARLHGNAARGGRDGERN